MCAHGNFQIKSNPMSNINKVCKQAQENALKSGNDSITIASVRYNNYLMCCKRRQMLAY